MRGWTTAAEVGAGLTAMGYEVSAQTLTNWKTRGVSKDALLVLPQLLNVSAEWLAHGREPMTMRDSPVTAVAEPPNGYIALPPDRRALLDEYNRLTPSQRREFIGRMREQAEANREILDQLNQSGDQ
jgi:hypothetical protein